MTDPFNFDDYLDPFYPMDDTTNAAFLQQEEERRRREDEERRRQEEEDHQRFIEDLYADSQTAYSAENPYQGVIDELNRKIAEHDKTLQDLSHHSDALPPLPREGQTPSAHASSTGDMFADAYDQLVQTARSSGASKDGDEIDATLKRIEEVLGTDKTAMREEKFGVDAGKDWTKKDGTKRDQGERGHQA